MRPIHVFKAEVEAGLADAVRGDVSLAYLTPITKVSRPSPEEARVVLAHLGELPSDPTLVSFQDILVTTCRNLNDDIVLPEVAWAARHTIDDKPINLGHVPADIIGHVVGSQAVDADYSPIDDDTPVDGLPDFFHILNQSVIYRFIGDEGRDERAALLEREIAEGKWYVSMEAYFGGFDYGFLDEDTGEEFVVARRSDTAFLTQHLRQYKGDGRYTVASTGKRYVLGRVVRDMHFRGKGIVAKPGNEHSIIFAEAARRPFVESSSKALVYSLVESLHRPAKPGQEAAAPPPSTEPAQETPAMPEIPAELATAQARIAELEAQVKANAEAASKTRIDELEATVSSLQGELDGARALLTAAQAKSTAFEGSLDEAQGKLAEAETAAAGLKARLDGYEAAERKAARVAFIVEAGQADHAVAASLAETLDVLSQEAFESTVTAVAKTWKPAAPAKAAPVADPAEAVKAALDVASAEAVEAAFIAPAATKENEVAALAKALETPNIRRPTI